MTKHYDVCIIGGGIQGCGMAQAAAAEGYSVLLLEQSALASATSSCSSKLIHGGLRYLESGQFSLVAESLAERELLLKNAPELVHRVPFYIPVYKHTRRRPWQIFTGLSLYALLGRFHPNACFRKVSHDRFIELDGIKQQELQSVYQYWDAQTDDAALTRAVMYSAVNLGAEYLTQACFEQARLIDNVYQVDFKSSSGGKTITSTALVNASGPWIRETQQRVSPQVNAPDIELVQGTHLLLRQSAPQGVYYVESPSDGRAVFIMPWHGRTLVGTTETLFRGDPHDIKPTDHEVEYLRNIVHYYFPHSNNELEQQFAGARVLPISQKSAFQRSRDTLFFTDRALPGYVAMVGGKLTGYRRAADRAMSAIKNVLPARKTQISTREIKIVPAPAEFS